MSLVRALIMHALSLNKISEPESFEIEALEDDPDQFMQSALYVQRGYQPPQASPLPIWVRFRLPLSQRKMVAM